MLRLTVAASLFLMVFQMRSSNSMTIVRLPMALAGWSLWLVCNAASMALRTKSVWVNFSPVASWRWAAIRAIAIFCAGVSSIVVLVIALIFA